MLLVANLRLKSISSTRVIVPTPFSLQLVGKGQMDGINAINLEYSYGGRRLLEGTTGPDTNGNDVLQTVEGRILDGTC